MINASAKDSNSTKVSIIMPVMNSGKHLKPCIDALINNTHYPYWRLIIIESESTDGTAELCDEYAKNYNNIEVYHTPREGITKAINFGIKKAENDSVYLHQDDVIIPNLYGRDWLTELVTISKLANCGLVTTIRAGGISGPTYLDGLNWVGTWSLYIPRKTINEVGLFDEMFSPGPGDDIDYTYRVTIIHKKHIYQANFWVDHHRMTENFNDNIEDIKKRNAEYFRKKHKVGEFKE